MFVSILLVIQLRIFFWLSSDGTSYGHNECDGATVSGTLKDLSTVTTTAAGEQTYTELCTKNTTVKTTNGYEDAKFVFYKEGYWSVNGSELVKYTEPAYGLNKGFQIESGLATKIFTYKQCDTLNIYLYCEGVSDNNNAAVTLTTTKPDDSFNCGETDYETTAVIYNQEDYDGQNVGDGVCSDANFIRGFKIIGALLMVAKCAIPLIIIIIGSINMFKAVTSDKSDELVKCAKNLGFRIAIGIAVFFLPSIILAFTNMTGLVPDEYKDCSKCVLDVTKC